MRKALAIAEIIVALLIMLPILLYATELYWSFIKWMLITVWGSSPANAVGGATCLIGILVVAVMPAAIAFIPECLESARAERRKKNEMEN